MNKSYTLQEVSDRLDAVISSSKFIDRVRVSQPLFGTTEVHYSCRMYIGEREFGPDWTAEQIGMAIDSEFSFIR